MLRYFTAAEVPDEVKARQTPNRKRHQYANDHEELRADDARALLGSKRIKREAVQHGWLECSACCESKPQRNTTQLDCCELIYCRACFEKWFETWLADKSLPTCCGSHIDIDFHRNFVKTTVKKKYFEVKEELEADRKIACGYEKCRNFIAVSQEACPYILFIPNPESISPGRGCSLR